jgi:chromosomal replication initiation ATPase DnaA
MPKSGEPNIKQLIKCLADVYTIAQKGDVVSKLVRIGIAEKSEARKQAITIILDEVCRHFKIEEPQLRSATSHDYGDARTITYYMMYFHAAMTQTDIAKYWGRSFQWINKQISVFKKLNVNIKQDAKVMSDYDCIYKNYVDRINRLTNSESALGD